MNKRIWIGLLIPLIIGSSCIQNPENTSPPKESNLTVLRQPAEYDPQDAIWLIWSPIDHKVGYSNEAVTLEIIESLVPYTRVIVTAATEELYERAQDKLEEVMEKGEVELLQIPSEELWVRDMGPNFVELTNGEKAVVDFGFNAWGYTPSDAMDDYTIRMEKYDEEVAKIKQLPLITTELISEGGDREVNGEGVLLVVETVEQGRNPDMSLEEMEEEFKRVLGVEKVIWLKEGLYEDDHTFRGTLPLENGERAFTVVTTNGHIDEFARFVNDSTILLAEVPEEDLYDPVAQENHRRMEGNYAILKEARDQNGKHFHIVRMPLPKLIVEQMKPGDSVYDFISTLEYEDGTEFPTGEPVNVIAAASYLNFLITDQVIIGQKYWREGQEEAIQERDETVRNILQELFPSREVVMLDALAINLGGGGIHCITMHEPRN
ncbi:MAG: agmatine deiminase family protein [Bacteroidota bacterium]